MTAVRQNSRHQLLFICICLQDINLEKEILIKLPDVH